MKENVLIYHGNCPDGFGAAWSFWKKFGNDIEFYPSYQNGYDKEEVLALVDGKNVYMADLCFDSREMMIEINKISKSFICLDHHKTSFENCKDLDFCLFRMDRSGAVMAWEYLYPDIDIPPILSHIQDRDLFIWEMIGSKEVLTRLDTLDKNFEAWDRFNEKLSRNSGKKEIIQEGQTQLVYLDYIIREHISRKHLIEICGYKINAVNAGTRGLMHEVASELARTSSFGVAYRFNGKSYSFSLRSRSDFEYSVDVSKIAEYFGGGGHFHAAAFMVDDIRQFYIDS